MQMAMLPSPIYMKMKEVFRRYEMGELKNQKSRKMSKQNLQKLMEGKYSPKLQHFKIFQGLTVSLKLAIVSPHVSS